MAVTPALPGVNVDQVAMLWQAGGTCQPDPVCAARPGQYHGADVVFAGPVQAVGNCLRGLPDSRARVS